LVFVWDGVGERGDCEFGGSLGRLGFGGSELGDGSYLDVFFNFNSAHGEKVFMKSWVVGRS